MERQIAKRDLIILLGVAGFTVMVNNWGGGPILSAVTKVLRWQSRVYS